MPKINAVQLLDGKLLALQEDAEAQGLKLRVAEIRNIRMAVMYMEPSPTEPEARTQKAYEILHVRSRLNMLTENPISSGKHGLIAKIERCNALLEVNLSPKDREKVETTIRFLRLGEDVEVPTVSLFSK